MSEDYNGRRYKRLPGDKPRSRHWTAAGRRLIFQVLMPGVFLFSLFYYVFCHRPSVADFYCNQVERWLDKSSHHSLIPTGKPVRHDQQVENSV